jgi:hypothetical protein
MSGAERTTRVAANARAAMISNVANLIVGLAAVPLTLRALGFEADTAARLTSIRALVEDRLRQIIAQTTA